MHHIHVTKYENGKQIATSLFGQGGIPYRFKIANEARSFAATINAQMNRLAKTGTRYEVEASGTPEWRLAVDERLGAR